MPHFIDSHCHLDFAELNDNLAEILKNSVAAGIKDIIIPGITLSQSQSLFSFKNNAKAKDIQLHIALGLHPYFLEQHSQHDMNALTEVAKRNEKNIIAIGECGIDSTINNIELQMTLFLAHITLANQLSLPLIIHHRQSHHLIAQAFKKIKPKYGGVIHAFSGSLQQAEYYIKQGFKLGVGGGITYTRAQKTRRVFSEIALEHLVLETDAPSMPVSGQQGKVNTPLALITIFESLVALRPEPAEEIKHILYNTCCDTFRL